MFVEFQPCYLSSLIPLAHVLAEGFFYPVIVNLDSDFKISSYKRDR